MESFTKDAFISRCAARYKEKGQCSDSDAKVMAENNWEQYQKDMKDKTTLSIYGEPGDPESYAEEEMTYW